MRMAGARRALSQQGLFGRVAEQANKRGVALTLRQFEGWRDRKLLMAGERVKAPGRAPTWAFDYRHYRRSLQLVRLYAKGVTDTDAVRIQLFLRGYGMAPSQIRPALAKEFRKAVAKLRAEIRSTHAYKPGDIPMASISIVRRELGLLDPRLKASGFELNDFDTVAIARSALSPDGMVGRTHTPTTGSPGLGSLLAFAWSVLRKSWDGVLALDDEFPSDLQTAIADASDAEIQRAAIILNSARTLFRAFDNVPILEIFGGGPGKLPGRLVSKSLLRREFSAIALAMFINLIRNSHENGVTGGLP